MKRYKLLQYLPGAVPGMLVDCSSDKTALELRIIPSDYPTWFEELPESQEREDEVIEEITKQIEKEMPGLSSEPDLCWVCKKTATVDSYRYHDRYFHPGCLQPQEKEECKHDEDEFNLNGIDPDKLFPPQPKQKPSEVIRRRLEGSYYDTCTCGCASACEVDAILDFLDEQFAKSQDKE